MIHKHPQPSLVELETQIAAAEVQLASLKYRRNFLASPLCRIAPDILGGILLELHKESHRYSTKSGPWQPSIATEFRTEWTQAINICRTVREVAISHGALWSFVDSSTHGEQWKSLCLERSRGHLLHVHHYANFHDFDDTVYWDSCFLHMQSLMKRSHQLILNVSCFGSYSSILDNEDEGQKDIHRHPLISRLLSLINEQMPNLISLDLHCRSHSSSPLSLAADHFKGAGPVHLRHLTLEDFSLENAPEFPSLEWLALRSVQFWNSVTGRNHLIKLLNSAANLRSLLVDNSNRDMDPNLASQEFSSVVSTDSLTSMTVWGTPRLIYEVLRILPDPLRDLHIWDTRCNDCYNRGAVFSGSVAGIEEFSDATAPMSTYVLYIQTRVGSFLEQANDDGVLACHLIKIHSVHGNGVLIETEHMPEFHRKSTILGTNHTLTLRLICPASTFEDIDQISVHMDAFELVLDNYNIDDTTMHLLLFAPLVMESSHPLKYITFVNPYFEDRDYWPLLAEGPRWCIAAKPIAEPKEPASRFQRRASRLRYSSRRLHASLERLKLMGVEVGHKFRTELIISNILAELYAVGRQVPTVRFRYHTSWPAEAPFPDPALRAAISQDLLRWRVGEKIEWFERDRLLEVQIPGGSKCKSDIQVETDAESPEEVSASVFKWKKDSDPQTSALVPLAHLDPPSPLSTDSLVNWE